MSPWIHHAVLHRNQTMTYICTLWWRWSYRMHLLFKVSTRRYFGIIRSAKVQQMARTYILFSVNSTQLTHYFITIPTYLLYQNVLDFLLQKPLLSLWQILQMVCWKYDCCSSTAMQAAIGRHLQSSPLLRFSSVPPWGPSLSIFLRILSMCSILQTTIFQVRPFSLLPPLLQHFKHVHTTALTTFGKPAAKEIAGEFQQSE